MNRSSARDPARDPAREIARDIEGQLRTRAEAFRREPPCSLRDRVLVAIDAEAAKASRAPFDEPSNSRTWRDRLKTASVAAAVLAAAGFWVVALAGVFGGGATKEKGNDLVVGSASSAFEAPTRPSVLVQLARAAPESLTTAVENPLIAELDRIGQDATRAARFLVGRLPSQLLTREGSDSFR
jgi:hypothetical protein